MAGKTDDALKAISEASELAAKLPASPTCNGVGREVAALRTHIAQGKGKVEGGAVEMARHRLQLIQSAGDVNAQTEKELGEILATAEALNTPQGDKDAAMDLLADESWLAVQHSLFDLASQAAEKAVESKSLRPRLRAELTQCILHVAMPPKIADPKEVKKGAKSPPAEKVTTEAAPTMPRLTHSNVTQHMDAINRAEQALVSFV